MTNNTKWNSNLFSNENTEKNKNIDVLKMNNRIDNIKNIEEIEGFSTVYDKELEEKDNVEVDENDNIKEGLFAKCEFTGYDWEDPEADMEGLGIFEGIADVIDIIYDKCTYYITKLARDIVINTRGNDDTDEKREEHNVQIVRKYIAYLISIILSTIAVFNWYFVTAFTYEDDKRIKIVDFLINNKIADIFYKAQSDYSNKLKALLAIPIFFVFEYVMLFYDDFNQIFLKIIPNYFVSVFGKQLWFVVLFIMLINVFYYSGSYARDFFKSLFTGKIFSSEGITTFSVGIIIYIVLRIIQNYTSSSPNTHYLSDFNWVLTTFGSGGIAGALGIMIFVLINVFRIMMIFLITITHIPALIGLTILFYSFFPILIFGNIDMFNIYKKINKECSNDFTPKKKTYSDSYEISDWIDFYFFTGVDFIYKSLFTLFILIFAMSAGFDFYNNIKGQDLKTNLTAFSIMTSIIALILLINSLSNIGKKNLQKGNLEEPNNEGFEFDPTVSGEFKNENKNNNMENINKKLGDINGKMKNK